MAKRVCKILADGSLMFYCPACKQVHAVDRENFDNNESLELPSTFGGSIQITSGKPPTGIKCHFILRDGMIYYWDDSSHRYSDYAVEMIPEELWFDNPLQWYQDDEDRAKHLGLYGVRNLAAKNKWLYEQKGEPAKPKPDIKKNDLEYWAKVLEYADYKNPPKRRAAQKWDWDDDF